eukprot:464344-Alexandrium_andersonii.AAC.1
MGRNSKLDMIWPQTLPGMSRSQLLERAKWPPLQSANIGAPLFRGGRGRRCALRGASSAHN